MQFTQSVWLWGLLGLSVPLAIHLLSRKEGKVIRVGSIRHLTDSTTRQFRSLKLNELLLLAVRSLLIGMVCLLLSGLLLKTDKEPGRWVLVEHTVDGDANVRRLVDSLADAGYERKYFEENFPARHDSASSRRPDYWGLAEQLGKQQLAHAIVFSPSFMHGFTGERSELPAGVTWVEVPVSNGSFQYDVVLNGGETYEVLGSSNAQYTTFSTQSASGGGRPVEPVRVAIVADTEHTYDSQILAGALEVLDMAPDLQLRVEVSTPGGAEMIEPALVFWLAAGVPQPGTAGVVVLKEQSGGRLIQKVGPKTWELTKRLNREAVFTDHLVVALSELFRNREPNPADDLRVMPESWRWTTAAESASSANETAGYSDFSLFLVLLILLALTAERLIAWRRQQ